MSSKALALAPDLTGEGRREDKGLEDALRAESAPTSALRKQLSLGLWQISEILVGLGLGAGAGGLLTSINRTKVGQEQEDKGQQAGCYCHQS